MSFFGGPRFSGGGQIFPNQSSNSLAPPAPIMQRQFQQTVMQMQMQLQKNLQNMQNRHNAPNSNMQNFNENPKGGNKAAPNFNNKALDDPNKRNIMNKPQNDGNKPNANSMVKGTNNTNNQSHAKKEERPTSNTNSANQNNNSQRNLNTSQNMNEKPINLNDKGPNKPTFANNTQNSPNKVSLMGNPPGLINAVKNEGIPNMKDRQNQGPQPLFNPSNQNSSYDGRHNQNKNYGRPHFNASPNPHNNDFRQPNSNRGHQQGGGQMRDYKGAKNFYGQDKIKDKAVQMFSGPQIDLPPADSSEKKFNNFSKLFVGNITKNSTQEEVQNLFTKFGEVGSVYLNKDSSFAFVQFDYKSNASKAMRELDNTVFKGRNLKVRFATISEGIKVKNLSPYISNELLEKAFSVFGTVESCRILSDDRGISKGEGILIFKDKKAAFIAVKKCQEECFFLCGALRPAIVSALDASDETSEGLPEASLPKNDEYYTERQVGPHFAELNSFEFDFGNQWKQLYSMYEEKKTALDRDFQMEIKRIEKKMVLAKVEYEAEKLRKELAQREAESAELRRHFEVSTREAAAPASPMKESKLPPGASAGSNYDSYGGAKRPPPVDPSYDASYKGPYEKYAESYDHGTYTPVAYGDRAYDRAYDYGREDYRRDAGYGHDRYERPGDLPPERPLYDATVDPAGYGANPTTPAPYGNDPHYPAPNKRPRY